MFACVLTIARARVCMCVWVKVYSRRVNVWMCVCACSIAYAICNSCASYRYLWPVWLLQILRHYLINDSIFGKKGMCVLIFSTNLFKTFLITRKIQRDIVINMKMFSCKLPVILVRFYWNLNFLDIFPNIFRYKVSLKSVQWESSCFEHTNGQPDRRDEANRRFWHFCERA
jgi:hypothetical protein